MTAGVVSLSSRSHTTTMIPEILFRICVKADPVGMIGAYGDLMYNFGLVDQNQLEVVEQYVATMKQYIEAGDYTNSYLAWDKMLNGDLYPYPTFWKNATGGTDYFNILRDASPAQFDYFQDFLTQPEQRK